MSKTGDMNRTGILQTAKPSAMSRQPTALPFPIRAIFERRSEGHRWVIRTGGTCRSGFVPADWHERTTSPAHFLRLTAGERPGGRLSSPTYHPALRSLRNLRSLRRLLRSLHNLGGLRSLRGRASAWQVVSRDDVLRRFHCRRRRKSNPTKLEE
jgi:hypothetical protein